MEAGDLEGAEGTLRSLRGERPGDGEVGFLLARVLYWRGDRAESLRVYGELLAVEPGNGDWLLGKAHVLLAEGRREEARAAVEAVLARDPDYGEARRLLEEIDREGRPPPEPAAGPRDAPPRWWRGEVEASVRRDLLSGGRDGWNERSVEGTLRTAPDADPAGWEGRGRVSLRVREAERSGERDRAAGAAAAFPLDRSWTLGGEGEASPDHRFLPRWSLGGTAARDLGEGWVASLSPRRVEYGDASVFGVRGTLEKYLGSFRAAAAVDRSVLFGGGTALGWGASLDRYYGPGGESRVGVAAGTGEELESLPGAGVLRTRVLWVAVRGRHWLDERWAITWEAALHRQGSLYTRRGVQVGLLFRF